LGGEVAKCDFDDGQYINIGPWRIPYWHRSTLYYTKKFNVPLEIMVNENDASFVMAGDVKGGLAGKRVRQAEIKSDLRGYTAELVATRPPIAANWTACCRPTIRRSFSNICAMKAI
jgi:monoamine oxidase